jgi:hypothetical protein
MRLALLTVRGFARSSLLDYGRWEVGFPLWGETDRFSPFWLARNGMSNNDKKSWVVHGE